MSRYLAIAVGLLLTPASVGAASAVEATRSRAAQATQRATDLRSRQAVLHQELEQVAGQIEALKGQHKRPLPGSDLEAALRRSQELSGILSEVARNLAGSE